MDNLTRYTGLLDAVKKTNRTQSSGGFNYDSKREVVQEGDFEGYPYKVYRTTETYLEVTVWPKP